MSNEIDQLDRAQRPNSLAAVAQLAHGEGNACGAPVGDFYAWIREFLDSFYIEQDQHRRGAMLAKEPVELASANENAYIAGVAEHLALRYELPVPAWVHAPSRFLKRAFFPCGLESLKAMLIAQSPAAFRRRMIFVELDPLYRPRRDVVGYTVEAHVTH